MCRSTLTSTITITVITLVSLILCSIKIATAAVCFTDITEILFLAIELIRASLQIVFCLTTIRVDHGSDYLQYNDLISKFSQLPVAS